MTDIHPTAIIDSRARIGHGVKIGPHCVIEGDVQVGDGTRLLHRVSLQGPLRIGAENTLYPNVCLGFGPQDLKFDPGEDGAGTVIGDRNTFREGVSVHRSTGGTPTTIGSDNYFMANSHAGHDASVGDHIIIANGVLLAGHTIIEDRVILGGGAAVHQFCRIGRMSMIGGLVAVIKDVPPFCMVTSLTAGIASLNIVGLRRSGMKEHVAPLKRAFNIAFRSRLARPSVVAQIRSELANDPLCQEFADFIEQSKRGIGTYTGTRGDVPVVVPVFTTE